MKLVIPSTYSPAADPSRTRAWDPMNRMLSLANGMSLFLLNLCGLPVWLVSISAMRSVSVSR